MTSRLVPLIWSLPLTSNLPPPRPLTAVEWKVACGNLAVLNQLGRGSSASLSGTPRVALAMSTVKAILLVSGLEGSKAICASNFLKRPSTGTPICLLTKIISLWAGTSFCWASASVLVRAEMATKADTTKREAYMEVPVKKSSNDLGFRTHGLQHFNGDQATCG